MKFSPIVKWAGGKRQLMPVLDTLLPTCIEDMTYYEPFAGGAAMFFHLYETYGIRKAFLNDGNKDLIKCYELVRDDCKWFIKTLQKYERKFLFMSQEQREDYFYDLRAMYNAGGKDRTVLFYFLNKTCYNGLYRENQKGMFNAPFGKYKNPSICRPDVIEAASAAFKSVTFSSLGFEDFFKTIKHKNSFIYADPPYRPLSDTASFKEYLAGGFGDIHHAKLSTDCEYAASKGAHVMVSAADKKDDFDSKYMPKFERVVVKAARIINSDSTKRGDITEIVLLSY